MGLLEPAPEFVTLGPKAGNVYIFVSNRAKNLSMRLTYQNSKILLSRHTGPASPSVLIWKPTLSIAHGALFTYCLSLAVNDTVEAAQCAAEEAL